MAYDPKPVSVAPRCAREGCDGPAFPCYLDDDLLADPQRVTEHLCPLCAHEAGYCPGCGRFWAGVESFDFSGLCDDCRAEAADDEGDWESEDAWDDLDPYEE